MYLFRRKGKTLSEGSLSTVLAEAATRGAIQTVKTVRRGWEDSRIVVDLFDGYEIVDAQEFAISQIPK